MLQIAVNGSEAIFGPREIGEFRPAANDRNGVEQDTARLAEHIAARTQTS